MKIIATIDSRSFIAELSFIELDYLAGKKVGSDKGYYGNEREIPHGTVVNIIEGFDQIHRNERRLQDVETLKHGLRGLLAGLDMMKPFIEEPKPEDKAADA